MIAMKKLSMRVYIVLNLVFALLFANVLFFGPALRMGAPFTSGLATGIAVGWIIFAIAGWRELKRPGRAFDERQATILCKAGAFGFSVLILVSCFASIFLRSELLDWEITARDMAALMSNVGMVAFFLAWVVIGKKS